MHPFQKPFSAGKLALIAATIPLLAACELIPLEEDEVWVHIDPIQCLGNPWQRAWLQSHDARYEDYPSEQDLQIFEAYYRDLGITIFDVEAKRVADVVCAACVCPTGTRYYLLTTLKDADRLMTMRFRKGGP